MSQRNPHPTKAGPGRRHKSGQPHGRAPKPSSGAPAGFVQHTNPKRREFRAQFIRDEGNGIRQWKRLQRKARAVQAQLLPERLAEEA